MRPLKSETDSTICPIDDKQKKIHTAGQIKFNSIFKLIIITRSFTHSFIGGFFVILSSLFVLCELPQTLW